MSEIVNPLEWPVGRPRSSGRREAAFGAGGRGARLDDSLADLEREMRLLRATNVVITYNRRISDADKDPGAAVYFELPKIGKHTLACDRWTRTGDNLRAITLHVEALRGMERWGVGNLAAAFAGYRQLAAVGERPPWWAVMGFKARPTRADAETKYKELMRQHHPDRGGNANQAAEITAAWQEARAEMESAR